MTQPTVIYFGPDAPNPHDATPPPKVYLRTLLFTTAKRGRIIESMHVALFRNEMRQNFNIWVYGEEKLFRGSGLFVGETGVVANHHFLTPEDGLSFRFNVGQYRLELHAHLLGDRNSKLLFAQILEVSHDVATKIADGKTGLYFDWGPDGSRYIARVDKRAPSSRSKDSHLPS